MSSVTHLAPNVASDEGIKRKDVGDYMILCDGPWRLDTNLRDPEVSGEERKLSYDKKKTDPVLYSTPSSLVVPTACLTLGK